MINEKVEYSKDVIRLVEGEGKLNNGIVMHKVAKPITRRFCEIVGKSKGDILDIGFGLGFSADYFQTIGVKSYTCIEINKEIYYKALDWAKDKSNVKIILGDWIDILPTLNSKFDGIFMDTYGDDKEKYAKFEEYSKRIANEGCTLALWEYPQFRKLSSMNVINFPVQKESYELLLNPNHKICWTYFFAGEFRKKQFYVKKNVVPVNLCKKIINENKNGIFRRDTASAFIDELKHDRDLYTKPLVHNQEFFDILKKEFYPNFKGLKSDDLFFCRFIKYETGGRHDRHVETDRHIEINSDEQFRDSIVVTLNDDFTGGEFLIYDSWVRDNRKIFSNTKTKAGDIIKFNPYQHCKTKEVSKGTKYEIFIKIKRKELIEEATSLI